MNLKHYIVLLMVAFISAGCHLIDDDLSVCGADYLINYQMRLVTEIQTTIDEKLSSETEQTAAQDLRQWLEPIFSGRAHDLEMNFYSLDGTDELKHHFADVVDDTRKSYTLTIPRKDYFHLAVVNLVDNDNVSLSGTQYTPTLQVNQRRADTLPSHPTAVYTARLPMIMPEDKEQDLFFDVHLYMISCAVAVVVTNGQEVAPRIKEVYLSGSASDFAVQDSVFSFNHNSLIRAERVDDDCYAMVSLPSAERKTEQEENHMAPMKAQEEALWQARVYVQLPDGKITENILSIDTPLRAGTLEILKVRLHDDGSLEVLENAHVGVTVKLDWSEGNEHELNI